MCKVSTHWGGRRIKPARLAYQSAHDRLCGDFSPLVCCSWLASSPRRQTKGPVLLTWVEAWPAPLWQPALGSHQDLGTSGLAGVPGSSPPWKRVFWQARATRSDRERAVTLTGCSRHDRSEARRHPQAGRHRGTGYGRSFGTLSNQW